MKVGNIKSCGYFRHEPQDSASVMTMEAFKADPRFGFEPDGVNYYIGISAEGQQILQQEGTTGLNATHQAFFSSLVNETIISDRASKQLTLGIEPLEKSDPFGFVIDNIAWITQIAGMLKGYQSVVKSSGKRLDIVVRFASEMNDRSNTTYGRKPDEYKEAFVKVRQAFKDAAPSVKFAFSPALRVDTDEAELSDYWPGDQYVDAFGGTWYVGKASDFDGAKSTLEKYVLHRVDKGLPFGISEIGGLDGQDNTAMIRKMLKELNSLSSQGIAFAYVNFFLDSKWGTNINLSFLPNP